MAENVVELPRDTAPMRRDATPSREVDWLDGRTRWAKRLKVLKAAYAADLGGDEKLSEMQRSLVQRAATLSVELEAAESEFAAGGKADADRLQSYRQSSSELRRLLESLGAKRPDTSRTPAYTWSTSDGDGVIVTAADGYAGRFGSVDMPGRYDLARRIAYAINQGVRDGKPLPPLIALIGVEVGMVALQPGQTLPDINEMAADISADAGSEDSNADD